MTKCHKTSNFNNRQKYKYQLFKLIKQQKYSFIFHSLLPFLYKSEYSAVHRTDLLLV